MYTQKVMRLLFRKLWVFFTLLLYLSAAMMASVHTASMLNPADLSGTGIDKTINTELGVSRHCHSMTAPQSTQPDSSLACEVLCAVMAQAISLEARFVDGVFASQLSLNQSFLSHISFYDRIEPRPPKLLS